MEKQFLLVEKYRPQTIDQCILPSELKNTFQSYITQQKLPNFLFHGTAGVGKTTVARALCKEVGADWLFINGSDESGIDTLRTKIKSFASTISLTDAKKVVIIDEAEYTNPNSFQPALRAFIEEFANNCTFIFTCNFKNRLIEPLHSRCAVIDFKIPNTEKKTIANQFFKRVLHILDQENITYDKKVVAELVQKHFPDFRRILNEIQRYSVSGTIDSGILVNLSSESFIQLFNNLKEKNFVEVRKWVGQSDGDTSRLFREIYDKSVELLEPSSIPQAILILADYQHKAAFVADQEINTMACLTELMASCKWR